MPFLANIERCPKFLEYALPGSSIMHEVWTINCGKKFAIMKEIPSTVIYGISTSHIRPIIIFYNKNDVSAICNWASAHSEKVISLYSHTGLEIIVTDVK